MDEQPESRSPEAAPEKSKWWIAENAVVITAATGLALVLVSLTSGTTMGATRSARLQWEQRREQVRDSSSQPERTDASPSSDSPAK